MAMLFSCELRDSLRLKIWASMPITQSREILAATRLDNVRYAIRDLASVADEVIKQGHKVLPLNVGDPLNFDFADSSARDRGGL